MRHRRHTKHAAIILAVLAAACSDAPPVSVTAIQVGRTTNADRTVAQPTFQFKPGDTIHVAVITDGEAKDARIRALWTYGSGTVSDVEQTVTHRDHGVTPFELRSAGGFPLGEYTLEVFLDGVSVGKRQIHVK